MHLGQMANTQLCFSFSDVNNNYQMIENLPFVRVGQLQGDLQTMWTSAAGANSKGCFNITDLNDNIHFIRVAEGETYLPLAQTYTFDVNSGLESTIRKQEEVNCYAENAFNRISRQIALHSLYCEEFCM